MDKEKTPQQYAGLLKLPLYVFGSIMMILGAAFLMSSEITLAITNDPTMGRMGLFRIFGAWMLGAAIATFSVGDNPERQIPVLVMLMVACGFGAGALIYLWSALEYRGDDAVILSAIGVLSFFAVIFGWGQKVLVSGLSRRNVNLQRYADEYFGRTDTRARRRSLGRRKLA